MNTATLALRQQRFRLCATNALPSPRFEAAPVSFYAPLANPVRAPAEVSAPISGVSASILLSHLVNVVIRFLLSMPWLKVSRLDAMADATEKHLHTVPYTMRVFYPLPKGCSLTGLQTVNVDNSPCVKMNSFKIMAFPYIVLP